MAYFHCTDWSGKKAIKVTKEEAEQLKKQGEFVTEDPFEAANWED